MEKTKNWLTIFQQWLTWWLLSKRWAPETFVPSGICQNYCSQCQQMLCLPPYLVACEVENNTIFKWPSDDVKRLISDHLCDYCDVDCQSKINNILTSN